MAFTDPNQYWNTGSGLPDSSLPPFPSTYNLAYGASQLGSYGGSNPQDTFSGWGNSNYPVSTGGSNTNSSGFSVGGAGNLVGMGLGLYEWLNAQHQLKNLENTPYPNYTVSAPLQNSYNQANAMSNVGFTAGEKAAYKRNVNEASNTSFQRAIQIGGGNLSNAIQAGINNQGIGASANMSMADAELRRRNMEYASTLADRIQQEQDKATSTLINQRIMQEQNLGASSTAGLQSFLNSFNANLSKLPLAAAGI